MEGDRMREQLFDNSLLNEAIEAALSAGAVILEVYGQHDFEVEQKADDSPLTRADRAAHQVIAERLESCALPVLSEEGRSIPYEERSCWSRFWMVDPLDGTKEFISRNGEFTVNIALIESGKPVLGVVYVPVLDELYFGEEGKGAHLIRNARFGERQIESLPRSGADAVSHPFRVVGSRSHMNDETVAFIETLRMEHGQIDMVQRGSSLKICMVAAGDADIYPRFGPTMEWDTAAAHAVVRAAGKRMTVAGHDDEVCYNKKELLNPFFIVQ